MIKLYSYKEQKEVIMLEEDEWSKVEPYLKESIKQIQNYREKTGATLEEATNKVETRMAQIYYDITGVKVKSYSQVYNRRRANYGRVCTE